jgi:hypothetical protein
MWPIAYYNIARETINVLQIYHDVLILEQMVQLSLSTSKKHVYHSKNSVHMNSAIEKFITLKTECVLYLLILDCN